MSWIFDELVLNSCFVSDDVKSNIKLKYYKYWSLSIWLSGKNVGAYWKFGRFVVQSILIICGFCALISFTVGVFVDVTLCFVAGNILLPLRFSKSICWRTKFSLPNLVTLWFNHIKLWHFKWMITVRCIWPIPFLRFLAWAILIKVLIRCMPIYCKSLILSNNFCTEKYVRSWLVWFIWASFVAFHHKIYDAS